MRRSSPRYSPKVLKPFASLPALVASYNSASADENAIYDEGDGHCLTTQPPIHNTPPLADLRDRKALSADHTAARDERKLMYYTMGGRR